MFGSAAVAELLVQMWRERGDPANVLGGARTRGPMRVAPGHRSSAARHRLPQVGGRLPDLKSLPISKRGDTQPSGRDAGDKKH